MLPAPHQKQPQISPILILPLAGDPPFKMQDPPPGLLNARRFGAVPRYPFAHADAGRNASHRFIK
jgi:hypothetical protein